MQTGSNFKVRTFRDLLQTFLVALMKKTRSIKMSLRMVLSVFMQISVIGFTIGLILFVLGGELVFLFISVCLFVTLIFSLIWFYKNNVIHKELSILFWHSWPFLMVFSIFEYIGSNYIISTVVAFLSISFALVGAWLRKTTKSFNG
jgi:hypothetical protein